MNSCCCCLLFIVKYIYYIIAECNWDLFLGVLSFAKVFLFFFYSLDSVFVYLKGEYIYICLEVCVKCVNNEYIYTFSSSANVD